MSHNWGENWQLYKSHTFKIQQFNIAEKAHKLWQQHVDFLFA